jgi:hypothetical protein
MTDGDNSKPADGVGQAIRRLPTGLYELSPTLPPPPPMRQYREPSRWEVLFFAVGLHWKMIRRLPVASAMIGIAGLVILLSIERRGSDTVTPPATPTEVVHSASPIVDAATTPATPAAPETGAATLPLTTAAVDAAVQGPLRSRPPDDTGGHASERGADGSVANAGALGAGDSPVLELGSAPASRLRAEKHRVEAHHAVRRGTIKSARRKIHYRSFWDTLFPPLSYR